MPAWATIPFAARIRSRHSSGEMNCACSMWRGAPGSARSGRTPSRPRRGTRPLVDRADQAVERQLRPDASRRSQDRPLVPDAAAREMRPLREAQVGLSRSPSARTSTAPRRWRRCRSRPCARRAAWRSGWPGSRGPRPVETTTPGRSRTTIQRIRQRAPQRPPACSSGWRRDGIEPRRPDLSSMPGIGREIGHVLAFERRREPPELDPVATTRCDCQHAMLVRYAHPPHERRAVRRTSSAALVGRLGPASRRRNVARTEAARDRARPAARGTCPRGCLASPAAPAGRRGARRGAGRGRRGRHGLDPPEVLARVLRAARRRPGRRAAGSGAPPWWRMRITGRWRTSQPASRMRRHRSASSEYMKKRSSKPPTSATPRAAGRARRRRASRRRCSSLVDGWIEFALLPVPQPGSLRSSSASDSARPTAGRAGCSGGCRRPPPG